MQRDRWCVSSIFRPPWREFCLFFSFNSTKMAPDSSKQKKKQQNISRIFSQFLSPSVLSIFLFFGKKTFWFFFLAGKWFELAARKCPHLAAVTSTVSFFPSFLSLSSPVSLVSFRSKCFDRPPLWLVRTAGWAWLHSTSEFGGRLLDPSGRISRDFQCVQLLSIFNLIFLSFFGPKFRFNGSRRHILFLPLFMQNLSLFFNRVSFLRFAHQMYHEMKKSLRDIATFSPLVKFQLSENITEIKIQIERFKTLNCVDSFISTPQDLEIECCILQPEYPKI